MNWKDLSPTERADISRQWRDEGSRYARETNAFVDRFTRLGPEQAGEEPKQDGRNELAETVLEAVREANESGELADLREAFPPAYWPFVNRLQENGQILAPLLLLDSGQILVRVVPTGARQEQATTYLIDDLHIKTFPGILSFGRSPDRRYYAVARESGITVHDGWDGPTVTNLDWPTFGAREGVQEVCQLVPFPDGKRVLLATRAAIMVLEPQQNTIPYPRYGGFKLSNMFGVLEPQPSTILFPRERDESEDMWLNNPHGAVSPDGSLIAIGDRLTGDHLLFNDRYEAVGRIHALVDSAPCHASFSNEGTLLALSSYMYGGRAATVVVPTCRFPGLIVEENDLQKTRWFSKSTWEETRKSLQVFDKDLLVLDSNEWVQASAWRPGEFILGGFGFLEAFDREGMKRWWDFIGSSFCAIDISRDGRHLIASTSAGFLVILDLEIREADPFRLGTATHRERRRWLFWKKEKKPLVW
jgi:hypothetical protein